MLAQNRMETVWFIYSKLREAQKNGKFKDFNHYINALIPLARSVTQGIQKEFKSSTGFLKWYGEAKGGVFTCESCRTRKDTTVEPINGTKQHEMSTDEHFIFFNKKRNIILKMGQDLEKKKELY